MKIGIFGVGAVGGHVAVRLLAAQATAEASGKASTDASAVEVSLLVREKQRARIVEHGLTLRTDEGDFTVYPTRVYTDPATIEPQDLLIVGLKASSLAEHAETIRDLLKPDGTVVFLINGIPWWWTYGQETLPRALRRLDPDRQLWEEIGPERVVGCVVYSSNEVLEDGTILNRGGNRYDLGEPRHAKTKRLNVLAELFTKSQIPVQISENIHLDIWRKLLANASGNPISALTRLSSTPRGADPLVSDLMVRFRQEVIDIGLALGLALTDDDKKLLVSVGNVRPSMLQDAILQRPMEVDAILGQTQVFAREKNISTPVLDTVHSLLHGLDVANRIARESAE